jgi:hypothetical protein
MQNGYTKCEAEALDPAERMAVRYAVAMQNGMNVNWTTGEISAPESSED